MRGREGKRCRDVELEPVRDSGGRGSQEVPGTEEAWIKLCFEQKQTGRLQGPVSLLPGQSSYEGGLTENHVDGTANVLGGGGGASRKPLKSGMKELAVLREKVTEQHRQMGKGGKPIFMEDPKKLRPPSARTPCQQELDQVLERISTMRLPDERGPLEHLYSLHIPNCDKHGLYNLKQCKMSLNGQRGECWCVNPNTGKLIQGAPTVRGDPECHRFYSEQQEARGHAQ
ncbi:insulin-like growth factor-binding protein 2 isoform X2 [Tamandua tetradactyla]|uniref:insulin-like growth factor-binding protein 2 isoform X2 n=1 Tax=Tamandua tetradactyla TaxID=48850 RepID=UPI0040543DFC